MPLNKDIQAQSKDPKESKKTGTSLQVPRKRKLTKRRKDSFNLYLYKVLKEIHPEMKISSSSMSIMNSFVNDVLERILKESSHVMKINHRSTILAKDILTAACLLLLGDLAKHAVSEGTKALSQYHRA